MAKTEETHQRAPRTHAKEEQTAEEKLKDWVRREIRLAASGVPEEERDAIHSA